MDDFSFTRNYLLKKISLYIFLYIYLHGDNATRSTGGKNLIFNNEMGFGQHAYTWVPDPESRDRATLLVGVACKRSNITSRSNRPHASACLFKTYSLLCKDFHYIPSPDCFLSSQMETNDHTSKLL